MNLFDQVEVICGDIARVDADLIHLKYANGFHGADAIVSTLIGFEAQVPLGLTIFRKARNIGARAVAFTGVGPLFDFRYARIQAFARQSLETIARERPHTRTIATTIHGPGYGLDEREAFRSQLAGYASATPSAWVGRKIRFVEAHPARADRLAEELAYIRREGLNGADNDSGDDELLDLLQSQFKIRGTHKPPPAPAEKPKLFVAMPFAEEHRDEYDIAFVEAAHGNGFLCERLDMETYIGDVVDEIEKRIRAACGLIALLNDSNPNVYFEIGYAMALGKPILFVARKDQEIPFDVRGQRRIEYSSIFALRNSMRETIGALKTQGVLG